MRLEKLKEITVEIGNILKSEDFLKKSRKNEAVFTRVRKLTFLIMITFMLNLSRRSLQLKVNDLFEATTDDEDSGCTKQAFSKARSKILPEAFSLLNTGLKKVFYKNEDYTRFKGYRILSIDGSTTELPNVSELAEIYGVYNSHSKKSVAPAARISVLYDNCNNIIIDPIIDKYKSNERELAKRHLLNLLALNKELKIDTNRDLVIFDRGYPSLELIYFMEYVGIKYLFRIQYSFFKETNAVIRENTFKEKNISIKLSNQKIKRSKLSDINSLVKAGDEITFKLAIILLKTGQKEYLITNTTDLSYEELEVLYNLRWKIETCYDELKNKIEIENFSGLTKNSIEQDFLSSVFVFNYASLVAMTAQTEYDFELKLNAEAKKYSYKVNKNMVIGTLKNSITKIFLTKDIDKMLKKILKNAKKNMTAIKPGRSFERNKNHKPKFPCFRKSCL